MTTGDTLRPALRRVLAQDAGTSADAQAVAAAAFRAYERLAEELAPLIGEAGINAVCARSVHLTQREFPWLAPADSAGPRDAPFTHVRLSLEGQDPAVATDAAIAVLATFGELLASFIGDSLTTRLLREAWPDGFSDDTTLETTT
jgi:hypothetical protein